MSTRVRLALVPAVVLVLMLGIETAGLRAGKYGYVLVGVVVASALAAAVARFDLARLGVAAACGAAFTLSWNGVRLGGSLQPGDVLVLVALICLVTADPNHALRTPPWWVKQLVGVIVLLVLVQIFFPPSFAYLAQRTTMGADGSLTTPITSGLAGKNLYIGFKFIVAVAVIPLAVVGAVRVDRRALRWMALAFAAGTALSGWVATADHFGTNLGALLTGIPNSGSRQLGFTYHPNFLAAGLVIALPFAFYFAVGASGWQRSVGFLSLAGMVLGVYASGSRGGAVGVVIALACCIVLHPRTRGSAPAIGLTALGAGLLVVLAFPKFGTDLLRVTRLSGDAASTAGSNEVRDIVAAQGWQDFHHYPFAGIGLQASTDASQVYLQELASGGLLLFLGMCGYLAGGILSSLRLLLRGSALAGMMLAALLSTIALNFVEADLTDRFYYLPAAIIVGLLELRRREAPAQVPVPTKELVAV